MEFTLILIGFVIGAAFMRWWVYYQKWY